MTQKFDKWKIWITQDGADFYYWHQEPGEDPPTPHHIRAPFKVQYMNIEQATKAREWFDTLVLPSWQHIYV